MAISYRNTTNYSCTHMLVSSGAYASSPEKILKMIMWCSFVCFEVYFDQMCIEKFPKNYIFLYETYFLYKT